MFVASTVNQDLAIRFCKHNFLICLKHVLYALILILGNIFLARPKGVFSGGLCGTDILS